MNWHDFILSDKKSYRFARHLVFWLLWWVYFTGIYFHYQQTGQQQIVFDKWNTPLFIKSIVLVAVHVFTCYSFINFLLPAFLLRKRYGALTAGTLILCIIVVPTGYYLHKDLFPLIDSAFDYNPSVASQNLWWTSLSAGILSSPKVVAAATFIKVLKGWYLKQKEKERLEKEKLIADLQLLKAQLHPEFLFDSLENIYRYAQRKDGARASTILLKLSDLLSYTLYECDGETVLLEKEIKIVEDYMALQKASMGKCLETDIAIKGSTDNKRIPPLLLLPIIENGFSYCNNKSGKYWMNVEIRIDNDKLVLKMIHGKTVEQIAQPANGNGVSNVQKRLEILCPGNYELKTTVEPEIMMTQLKMALEESTEEQENVTDYPKQMHYATI